MNVSVITVEHACEILESEGYITAKARSGYYVEYTTEAVYRSADVSIKKAYSAGCCAFGKLSVFGICGSGAFCTQ